MSGADFITIDVLERPAGGFRRWRRSLRASLAGGIDGLRAATVNHATNATHAIVPRLLPASGALVAAWESPEDAEHAWNGPLRAALQGRGHFGMDGEVTRVRLNKYHHDWHGWSPTSGDAEPIAKYEPLVVAVHSIVLRGHLAGFIRNNVHAASRAAHHPGHRGSVDISSKLPFEHTSISLWRTAAMAEDYAYAPGGHSHAMKHSLTAETHRVGVFLRIRPLAASGSLGIGTPAFPKLPPIRRGQHVADKAEVNRSGAMSIHWLTARRYSGAFTPGSGRAPHRSGCRHRARTGRRGGARPLRCTPGQVPEHLTGLTPSGEHSFEDLVRRVNSPERPQARSTELFRCMVYDGHVGVRHETYRIAAGQFDAE